MIPKATLQGNEFFPTEAARIQESTQCSSSKGKRHA